LSFRAERSGVEEPRAATAVDTAECLDFARHDVRGSTANSNHLAVWLIIVSKVVLLRFSIDNVQKKLF
jgi:hypothetical protein